MIDLSYLTEEEQAMILMVLKRDAELKKAEEQRVRNLQRSAPDKGKLKYLTGEWFYETKSQRHRDRIHGSDIIMASMRQKKTMTILELSQMWTERPSFVNSQNHDVYVPPELLGLLEDPLAQLSNDREDDYHLSEGPKDLLKQSPTKQRQNPFNSTPLAPETSAETDSQLTNEATELTNTHDGEVAPPPSETCVTDLTNINPDCPENSPAALVDVPVVVPSPHKRTMIHRSQDSLSVIDGPAALLASSPPPRGILKHSPSCSSADSLQLRLACDLQQPDPPQSPQAPQTPSDPPGVDSREPSSDVLEGESLGWVDRKQVRFCHAVVRGGGGGPGEEIQDGKELGEHSLLDLDCANSPSEEKEEEEEEESQLAASSCNNGFEKENSPAVDDHFLYSRRPTDTQREEDLDEGLRYTEGPDVEGQDTLTGPTQVPADQHERRHAESLTPQVTSDLRPAQQESGYDEDSSPVTVALEQDQVSQNKSKSSRPISLSRSLEDITSTPIRDDRSRGDQRGELILSVDDVSATLPSRPPSSLLDPEQVKMSMSVPAFLQKEKYGRDNDCDSESSLTLGWRRKTTSSSLTNLSLSSGLASMSSVSGSVMSIYSGELGDVEVKGSVQFAMNYVQKLGEFHIFVIHCRDLAVAEPKKNRSDPYVKCYLLPDKAKMGKRKTSVKKKTLNPTYNEILRFKVTMATLKSQQLNVSVWHNDTFGRNGFLGQVDLDLSEWDFSNTKINDYALKGKVKTQSSPSRSQSVDHGGEMRVALRFLPQISYSKRPSKTETGEVQIWVKDCKNLPPARGFIIDPFVKCTVLPDTSRKSRQKTRVVKRTANPMFNHTMVYDGFRPEDLREACVEVTVWDHERLNNHFIGGLRLGLGTGKSYGAEVDWMDSTSDESSLWERMMESHSEWVEDVLPLRMLMMAKSMPK